MVERVEEGARQVDIVVIAGMVMTRSKKIPSWRAPGPDGVHWDTGSRNN